MGRHGEPAAQFGEPDQEQAQAVVGIHAEAGEQAQFLEDVVAQVVGLVEDQDRQFLLLRHLAGDLGPDPLVGLEAGARGLETEGGGDGVVGVEHAAGGQGDVAGPVEAAMEAVGDLPAQGGLAAAGLAGHEADSPEIDQVPDPRPRFLVLAGVEQLVGGEGGFERVVAQGEVVLVHGSVLGVGIVE